MKYELNNLYNEDCLAAMKTMPDKYFDLAIVDPPYGGGGRRFGKRNRAAVLEVALTSMRLKQRAPAASTLKNMVKQLNIGTPRRRRSILTNCLELVKTKLFGVVITLRFRRHDVSAYGES